ncbi:hypothetical protein SODALDRAFT_329795 [Sodiomyces alkalinus F11]|uniref:Uncharacterized protein n=1 Tax=Sodiomyces alkalinus (strain CBS 110278 / VKM F-3762 / F11) TaxID=1314773 RepID=A0A3N2PJ31_SODAK|nr:hypothetical protein SODALDRAFT_329795 [Sodiomyces alkalinus F11]ROT34543.1 hypothetical protein SODALDRAFT_329795 [Sodiomyces alkalinus F11]
MTRKPDEVQALNKRISEIIGVLAEEQEKLDDILRYLESISEADLGKMSRSASSARNRRRKAGTKSIKEEKEEYENKRHHIEAKIGRLWEKINDLQKQKEDLEKKG